MHQPKGLPLIVHVVASSFTRRLEAHNTPHFTLI